MNEKNIDYRFKFIYALASILVILGHGGSGIDLDLSGWFPYYSYHIALFVFCSGYFYKQENEQNVKAYIKKKIVTLIIPLYIYNLFYGAVATLLHHWGFSIGKQLSLNNLLIQPILSGHQFGYNMGGWFVIPLFMVEVYNILIRKIIISRCRSGREHLYVAINLLIGLVGIYFAGQMYISILVPIYRFCYFVPFYGLGIYYKKVLEGYEIKIPSIIYFGTILFIKLLIILKYGRSLEYIPSWCNDFNEGPIMPIIVAVLGIAFILRVARILEPSIINNRYIVAIADSSYSIMMNQFLAFMIVKGGFALLNILWGLCGDFDWYKFKNDIGYFYAPGNIYQIKIIYLIVAIVFSVYIQKLVNYIKICVRKR